MEISFQDLRQKEVVNIDDGKCLGAVCDIVFEQCSGKLLGIVVPGEKRFFSFKKRAEIFINYHHICKIGKDVILIDICDNGPYAQCNGGVQRKK